MFNDFFGKVNKNFEAWAEKYHYRFIIFNLILISLFLLHSVGYFYPLFPISINFIVLVAFVLSIILVGATSRVMFVAATIFWTVTLIFKLLSIEVWAERSGIYVFESFLIGVVLLVFENIKTQKENQS